MKVGTLFSGIGGFDLGFECAGMSVAWQCEIDKHALTVLDRHYPDVPRYGDVTTLQGDAVAPVDVLVGGFPCQDLSVAGRRAGLAGKRSGLFYEFARIIDEATPKWVVIENVPGLLSSNGGRDMGAVLGTLAELGYGFSYRVLDAQYFGVAQRRRRVFIVGYLGDWRRAAQVLLEPEGVRRDSPPSREAGAIASAPTRNGVGGGGGPDDNAAQANHLVSVTGPVTHTLRAEGADASEDGTGRGTPIVVAWAENSRAEVRYEGGDGQTVGALKTGGGKPGQGYPAAMVGQGFSWFPRSSLKPL